MTKAQAGAPEVEPAKLAEYYNEVDVDAHGPQQTVKMPWEDLGLDAEERDSLKQIASTGSWILVHEKLTRAFGSSIHQSRSLIEKVSVFAGTRHLVPAWRCDELVEQIEEKRQRFRWWLETEAEIDELQEEVRGRFRERAKIVGQRHGPEVEERVMEYVNRRIPNREQVLRWDYEVAVRPVPLNLAGLDPAGAMAKTVVRDAAVITAQIERRVRDRLLGVCEGLAKKEDLAGVAEAARPRLREAARFATEHNVVLSDPLVDDAARLLVGIAANPMSADRAALRRICGQLRAAQELSAHFAVEPATTKPEPLASIARKHLEPANTAVQTSLGLGL